MNRGTRMTRDIRSLIALLVLSGWLIDVANAGKSVPTEISEREKDRKALNDRFDKAKLRGKKEFVIDCSPDFLKPPDGIKGNFEIASVAPTVRLRILPDMVPEYFPEGEQYMAVWANWGRLTRSDDNRFYMAASDHCARGAGINVYEYRPKDQVVEKVLDVGEVLGWSDDMYTDGKIHGRMGIMPDGTLWGATHYGVTPSNAWYDAGYRGSWLFGFNINTREARNWGVPLIGNTLPEFFLDPQRGHLAATGWNNTFLCWDANEKKVRFAGYPPNGWVWLPSGMLCDVGTGRFWGMDSSEKPYRVMSFDPELNRFERYDVEIPPEPDRKHEQAILCGTTTCPDADGWYYQCTRNGAFFRFRPEGKTGPEIEPLGLLWEEGSGGQRVAYQLALSPDKRYVYYVPKHYRSAVVQYNVKTGKKKALCFLQDYYFQKYGYWMSACYGMEVSNDGSFLVILENGAFQGKNTSTYGHPGLLVVSIPAEERR